MSRADVTYTDSLNQEMGTGRVWCSMTLHASAACVTMSMVTGYTVLLGVFTSLPSFTLYRAFRCLYITAKFHSSTIA